MDNLFNKQTLSKAAIIGSAGMVMAVFTVIASASFASLIFNGPLEGFVTTGIRMALTTAVLVGILVAITRVSHAMSGANLRSNVVGEVGMFLGGKRMASVVTEETCSVYRLTAEALNRMRGEDPQLALAFHQFLVKLLAEPLTATSNMLRGYQE